MSRGCTRPVAEPATPRTRSRSVRLWALVRPDGSVVITHRGSVERARLANLRLQASGSGYFWREHRSETLDTAVRAVVELESFR